MFGPSLGDLSGSGCVSQNRPSTPIAIAARASGSTMARLPPVAPPKPARFLYAVRGVEDHRHAKGLHLRDRPHVVHQPAVAEKRAAFAQEMFWQPAAASLSTTCRMSLGAMNWPFFTCTARPGLGGRHQQVGLPRQERRNLQQRAHLGRRGRLVRFVNIGRHRQTGRFADALQNSQARLPFPAPRYASRLVRLALSNDALNTSCTGKSRVSAASRSAIESVSDSFSITHGPAMTSSFSPAPQRYGPILAGLLGMTFVAIAAVS